MKKQNSAYRSSAAKLVCVAAFFALAASGCGGGDDDAPAPAPAPSPPPLPTIAPAVDLDGNQQNGVTFWADGNTATGGTGQVIQNIACAPTLSGLFHIHSHLSIFVNGQARAIPANVGIIGTATTDCHYYIHTHDHSGKIHIEPPSATTTTLGQLFAIWGQPLTATNVAGMNNMPIYFYVTENNAVTQFTGDPATIAMLSHRHIAIVIGTPITQVPFFTWTAN
jgi:hypothetical protein